MNSKTWTCIVALFLLAALTLPGSLAAQNSAPHPHQYHHYQLNDVGTFGGPNSTYLVPAPGGRLLNNSGTAVGGADTATPDPTCFGGNGDCFVAHGFKWQNGVTHELDALPGFHGLNSAGGFWASDGGLTAGLSLNGIDPLTGFLAAEAVLWDKDGSLTDLGTFGGNDSVAYAVNNRGQVAGVALNTIPDPYTGDFGVFGATQAHAFLWTRSAGMQDLGTLGGTDSAGFMINQPGQIAGWSFTNTIVNPTTGIPTLDPFLWDKTAGLIDLGTLGGTTGQAYALNDRGQVVGQSNTQGDLVCHAFLWDKTAGMRDLGTLGGEDAVAIALNDAGDVVGQTGLPGSASCNQWPMHAFLWRKGVMSDLGSLDGIQFSTALSINAKGQIVGNVGDAVLATLWEDGGPLVDLNTLIPSNPGLTLFNALYINDRGEIAAQGTLSNGDVHSFVLIPCDENHLNVAGCDYSSIDAETAAAQRPTSAVQPPAALTQGTRVPGMLNRFRFPGKRPVTGQALARGASLALSATPATGDLLGDHQLVPQYGTPPSYCEISQGSNGVLTGGCIQSTGYTCNITSTGCNTGQPATLGADVVCANHEHWLSTTKCFSVPGFDLSFSGLTPTTVSAGGSATSTLTVSAYDGFSGSVAFSCSVQPAPALAPTCSFSPRSVTPGTPSTLTVSTIAPTSALRTGNGSGLFYAFFLPFGGLFAMVLRFGPQQKRNGKFTAATLACMLFACIVFQAACGAKTPTPGTPTGTYQITVTGADSSGTAVSSILGVPFYVQ